MQLVADSASNHDRRDWRCRYRVPVDDPCRISSPSNWPNAGGPETIEFWVNAANVATEQFLFLPEPAPSGCAESIRLLLRCRLS